ncbi:ATP-dependent Clp protease proteolytic subunit [Nitratireductor sp. L1-7-SE]|uniref:ATP-dependent Clp protease proteolytic subunit n=1 Tax=Nitratireductor rhodophyticola TaxID=2854036 RepID=A0ABS7R8I9_9HYPH|nr:ATP-dependent Clp protease proteolytic subunit [Nitratireductor rhodophyticola]MBY8916281.1 ATP-dependent Clp protease proteolytic subunit [Nitratireductor rhodophyticola]MBY8921644.1 ATP-dependent Clp protease proteolytic subunit [Nitratireductor rhodophyticola]
MDHQLATTADRAFASRWVFRPAAALDGSVLRAALFGAVIGTAVVAGMELRELADRHGGLQTGLHKTLEHATQLLPHSNSQTDTHPLWRQPAEGAKEVSRPTPEANSLSMTASRTGVLALKGMIQPGSAGRLRDALESSASPITTIALDSPGGSLNEAMAMARLIRQRGLSTSVEAGAACASSCPLVLAGGRERHVEPGATIALHQFYSPGSLSDPQQALSDAQLVTARISRHLDEMGVDPALWLHALDTPPRTLYRLTPAQMRAYRLTTGRPGHARGH